MRQKNTATTDRHILQDNSGLIHGVTCTVCGIAYSLQIISLATLQRSAIIIDTHIKTATTLRERAIMRGVRCATLWPCVAPQSVGVIACDRHAFDHNAVLVHVALFSILKWKLACAPLLRALNLLVFILERRTFRLSSPPGSSPCAFAAAASAGD